jgi:hypothetical protein
MCSLYINVSISSSPPPHPPPLFFFITTTQAGQFCYCVWICSVMRERQYHHGYTAIQGCRARKEQEAAANNILPRPFVFALLMTVTTTTKSLI